MAELAYAQSGSGGGLGPLLQTPLIPFAFMFLIFYFLLIRPQQQRAKERQGMISALKRNDEVMTAGGLYGRVMELNEKVVTLEIAPKVTVRVDRQHIDSVTSGVKSSKGSGAE